MESTRLRDVKNVTNSVDFERFCCEIARDEFGDFFAQRYGRSGQAQGGIDISAIDRRGKLGKVVIQCHFLEFPNTGQLQSVKNKFLNDVTAALVRHEFDTFVFATSFPPEKALQDLADDLCREHGKTFHIWSNDDLLVSVARHPRLRRLYLTGHADFGVELLNSQFIDRLKASPPPEPYAFYAGHAAAGVQWRGVLCGFDAPRKVLEGLKIRVNELFNKPTLDNKVVAVVLGAGGTGKSTLLRRFGLDVASDAVYTCWWVTNVEQFLAYDAISIGESSHLKHLRSLKTGIAT